MMLIEQPLADKKLRMKTIAAFMSALAHVESYRREINGDVFSDNERKAYDDVVDTLDYFITLSSAQT